MYFNNEMAASTETFPDELNLEEQTLQLVHNNFSRPIEHALDEQVDMSQQFTVSAQKGASRGASNPRISNPYHAFEK